MNLLLLGITILCVGGTYGQDGPTTMVGPCHRRDSGFARDVTHCAFYFVCQQGRAIRARCPGNLLFDADHEACWWADTVTCFECPQTQVYALLPVPNTCHQFYRCWRHRITIHTCPSDLVFDPNTRRCALLSGSTCEGDDQIRPSCPAVDGLFPVYMADAHRCEVYYICNGGQPLERQCSSGLHFNRQLQICDIPANANCQAQANPWDQANNPWDQDSSSSGTVQDLLGKPCPDEGHGFVPHRANCNAYFACSNQQPTLVNCAPNLHFDYVRTTCDRPQNARCFSHEFPPVPGDASNTGIGGALPLPPGNDPGAPDDRPVGFGSPGMNGPPAFGAPQHKPEPAPVALPQLMPQMPKSLALSVPVSPETETQEDQIE